MDFLLLHTIIIIGVFPSPMRRFIGITSMDYLTKHIILAWKYITIAFATNLIYSSIKLIMKVNIVISVYETGTFSITLVKMRMEFR